MLYMDIKKIAIIDDEETARVVLNGFAEEAGYEVVSEGASGEEAVDICSRERPDVMLLDIGLPGIDGIEAAALIAERSPTAVVLVTGRDDPDTIHRATEAGIMAYLVKPLKYEDFIATITVAISRFEEFSALKEENSDLKEAIEARKVIEKAKGLLIDKEGHTEAEAFNKLRKLSMDQRKPMREIAEVVISLFQ